MAELGRGQFGHHSALAVHSTKTGLRFLLWEPLPSSAPSDLLTPSPLLASTWQ